MSLSKWDLRFFTLAVQVASWSKDPNKKVGAVVISPDKRRISYGYNGFPAGIADDTRLDNKTVKNSLALHAEVNAILNAKTDLTGWSLYCSEALCNSCALFVIQAGIATVFMPAVDPSSSWYNLCCAAAALLREANITVNWIEENL